MHILNSCVIWQDSILQTRVCASQSSRTRSMTLAQPHFVVINCSNAVMNVFYSLF